MLLLLALTSLFACRPSPPPTPTPDFPLPPDTPTAVPIAAETVVPHTPTVNNDLFIPLISGQEPTATATAVLPTPEPPPPSPTPTPPYPVYAGPPFKRNQLGIQVHIRDEDLSDLFTHLNRLGVGWVKVQISWKLYESYPGDYAPRRWQELDRFVEIANDEGIQVLLSVSKAPEWSRPTTEMDGPPVDFAQFRRFTAYLAGRYAGRVVAYELWNEANLQREWNGFTLSPAGFAELTRQGAEGIRATDPHAIIISGAPATTGIDDGETAIDDRRFLREALAAGLAQWVDGVGVHPYGWGNPPDASAGDANPVAPSHNNHPSFFFKDTLADYRAILNQAGAGHLPLWATEFGWGSFAGLDAPPPTGQEFMTAVSEYQQAEYILRAFEMAQSQTDLGPLFLWNLNFGRLLGVQFSETGYSLLRPNGSPRPAYQALAAAQKE